MATEHSNCVRQFLLGNISDKSLLSWTVLQFVFQHISVNLTSSMDITTSVRTLQKNSLLTESQSPLSLNTLRTGDADLRFYIKTVQDG